MGGKYAEISRFLEAQTGNSVALSFAQIEHLLGNPLPESANVYQAWWSNSPVGSRHNQAWLRKGWATTELNLRGKTVRFVRAEPTRLQTKPRNKRPEALSGKHTAIRLTASPVAAAHDFALSFEWQSLGTLGLDAKGCVEFPKVTAAAGLYRYRIDKISQPQVYIGESSSLRRRFTNYRNPGPTQTPNIRLNALLREAITSGAVVSVDVIIDTLKVKIDGKDVSMDLNDKALRRMIEHAAIVASAGTAVEIVNL